MLWRALKHVDSGFYIDVGASVPVADSVTKAFYDAGWHGINIEPRTESFLQLVEDRDRDVNLQVAVGAKSGTTTFFDVDRTGLATCSRAEADEREKEGLKVAAREIEVRTLTEIWDAHAEEPVHFLKIDVEGWETEVIGGLDLSRCRPWIIVVEATKPNSTELSPRDWEAQLIPAGYEHVWFDGLNRYYVATEHSELVQAFSAPPNVFDDIIRYREVRAIDASQRAREWAEGLASNLKRIEASHEKVSRELMSARAQTAAGRQQTAALEHEVQQFQARVSQTEQALAQRNATIQRLHERNAAAERVAREQEEVAQQQQARAQCAEDLARAQEKTVHALRERITQAERTLKIKEQELAEQLSTRDQQLIQLQSELEQLRQFAQMAEEHRALLEQQLIGITTGLVWRTTSPVRALVRQVRKLAAKPSGAGEPEASGAHREQTRALDVMAVLRAPAAAGVRTSRRLLRRNPRIQAKVNALLDRQPVLKERLLMLGGTLAEHTRAEAPPSAPPPPQEAATQSEAARPPRPDTRPEARPQPHPDCRDRAPATVRVHRQLLALRQVKFDDNSSEVSA